jgi:hypothetical protein
VGLVCVIINTYLRLSSLHRTKKTKEMSPSSDEQDLRFFENVANVWMHFEDEDRPGNTAERYRLVRGLGVVCVACGEDYEVRVVGESDRGQVETVYTVRYVYARVLFLI